VLDAESSCVCVGGAPWHRAQPFGTVLGAALRLVHSHGGAISNQAHPEHIMFDARPCGTSPGGFFILFYSSAFHLLARSDPSGPGSSLVRLGGFGAHWW
jgi:hypothetical protein